MYCITMEAKANDLQAYWLNRKGSSHIFKDLKKKKRSQKKHMYEEL